MIATVRSIWKNLDFAGIELSVVNDEYTICQLPDDRVKRETRSSDKYIYIISHHITSRHVKSRHVTSRHVTYVTLRYVTLRYVTLYYIILYYIIMYYILLYITKRGDIHFNPL